MPAIRRRKNKEVVKTDVFREGCLINLSVGYWAARAKVKEDIYQDDISKDKDVLRTVQDLLDANGKKELKTFVSIYNETYNYLNANLLPCPIRSLKFVPKDKVEEIDKYLLNQRERFKEAVESFLENYDKHIQNFKKSKNKRLFRREKYPSIEKLRTKFYFEWIFRVLAVPDRKNLPDAIYKREVEKAKDQMQEIVNMTMDVVKNEFLAKITRLKEYTSDGKIPKKTINSIGRLFEKYDELWSGFIGHEELKQVIENIRKEIGKIDPDNDSEDYIGKVKRKVKKMTKAIDSLPDFESKRALDY